LSCLNHNKLRNFYYIASKRFEIVNEGKVVGVAQLCNKIGGGVFTKFDEMIATGFAVLCSISVMHVSTFLRCYYVVQYQCDAC